MHGFTRNPSTGQWYSDRDGGLIFDPQRREYYSVQRGVWTVQGQWPAAPANASPATQGAAEPRATEPKAQLRAMSRAFTATRAQGTGGGRIVAGPGRGSELRIFSAAIRRPGNGLILGPPANARVRAADDLLAAYQGLPRTERLRFWRLLDESEEEITSTDLNEVNDAPPDADGFSAFVRKLERSGL